MAGYKIDSNNLVAFLYAKNKWAEKEIREMKFFTRITNNIKYPGVTLTKQVKHLYEYNFMKKRNQRRHQRLERSTMIMDWQD